MLEACHEAAARKSEEEMSTLKTVISELQADLLRETEEKKAVKEELEAAKKAYSES